MKKPPKKETWYRRHHWQGAMTLLVSIAAYVWIKTLRVPGVNINAVGTLVLFCLGTLLYRQNKGKDTSSKQVRAEPQVPAPPSPSTPSPPKIVYQTVQSEKRGGWGGVAFGITMVALAGFIVGHTILENGKNQDFKKSMENKNPFVIPTSNQTTPGYSKENPRDHFNGPDRDSVIAFYSESKDSILIEIAACESHFRQFEDPERRHVLRGIRNHRDTGIFQINDSIYGSKINTLGVEILTLEGNMAFADSVFQADGRDPMKSWSNSAPCWRDHQYGPSGPAVSIAKLDKDTVVVAVLADGSWSKRTPTFGMGMSITIPPGLRYQVCVDDCNNPKNIITPDMGKQRELPSEFDSISYRSLEKQSGKVTMVWYVNR